MKIFASYPKYNTATAIEKVSDNTTGSQPTYTYKTGTSTTAVNYNLSMNSTNSPSNRFSADTLIAELQRRRKMQGQSEAMIKEMMIKEMMINERLSYRVPVWVERNGSTGGKHVKISGVIKSNGVVIHTGDAVRVDSNASCWGGYKYRDCCGEISYFHDLTHDTDCTGHIPYTIEPCIGAVVRFETHNREIIEVLIDPDDLMAIK